MENESRINGALTAIDELRIDSKIGKSKHFSASDRKMFWHRLFGVPVIIANLFVGIVLVNLQGTSVSKGEVAPTSLETSSNSQQIPWLAHEWLSLGTILLAFSAASLSGVQTFFNFHKASEGHRAIGNRYVHISRQCKAVQQKHRDIPYSPELIWQEYEKLYLEYNQINTEAESFTTSPADLKKAKSAAEISPYKNPHV